MPRSGHTDWERSTKLRSADHLIPFLLSPEKAAEAGHTLSVGENSQARDTDDIERNSTLHAGGL